MAISYLCIDDEEPAPLNALLDRLRRQSGNLEILLERPLAFDSEVDRIERSPVDGIILDLRLDEVPLASGDRIGYRAGSLAQELRTRMTEGRLRPFPIVLWSIDSKLRESYWNDETTHDLFDKIYYKSQVVKSANLVAVELEALAKGFQEIGALVQAKKSLVSILGLSNAEAASLDPRIGEPMRESRRTPVHEYSRYIKKELIDNPGPLVSDELLAARLGISREDSEDWLPLCKLLAEFSAYKGPFCQAWKRWWWFRIESWWDSFSNRPDHFAKPLRQRELIACGDLVAL